MSSQREASRKCDKFQVEEKLLILGDHQRMDQLLVPLPKLVQQHVDDQESINT